jgi:hypothetical protein
VRPKLVKNFISYFTNNHNNINKTEAWFFGCAIVVVEFIQILYYANFILKLEAIGIKMRTGLTSLIYRKVIKMNLSQFDNIAVGKIITLVTRDVKEFDICVFHATLFWCDSIRFSTKNTSVTGGGGVRGKGCGFKKMGARQFSFELGLDLSSCRDKCSVLLVGDSVKQIPF